jgi:N-acetylglucosaminyldiphosphoundecaprenol N-acetyl-beta-D-mannosaminyltransferase
MKKPENQIFMLYDTPINNITMSEALLFIKKSLSGNKSRKIFFVNADCINKTHNYPEYLKILQNADLVLPDGIGIRIAGEVLDCRIKENVNGTDMFPLLLKILAENKTRIFLLGARPGVSSFLADRIKTEFPDIIISGEQHGFYKNEEEPLIIEKIRESRTELLLVAFGAPKQEEWINKNLADCQVKVALGVGGLFDFYGGVNKRAPLWMRKIGLEWLYRVYQEPKRLWKRYFIGNFVFLFRLFRHKIKKAG